MPEHVRATETPSGSVPAEMVERGRSLVLAAFDEARASGRKPWDVMTTAVLKNRLLNSTQRQFDEKDYGASSMVGFARLFPDSLEVDTRSVPPQVRLLRPDVLPTPSADEVSDNKPVHPKVRPDLWRAMVDYRSDSTYVWDNVAALARAADPDDPNPVLPTLTQADVAELRREFVDSAKPSLTSERVAERLDEWLLNSYGSAFLPAALRGRWNGLFREKVLSRLNDFFAELGVDPPEDLLLGQADQSARRSLHDSGAAGHTENLRALVQTCVAAMSEDELADLRISPDVLLRALRRRA